MKDLLTCIAVAVVLASFAGCSDEQPQPPAQAKQAAKPAQLTEEPAADASKRLWRTVKRVIDGNTLELDDGVEVRLLGVDAPGIDEPFGKEAAEFARKMAEGQEVRLEYDQTRKDKDGGILARVRVLGPHFMSHEGLCGQQNFVLNEEIIYQGLGRMDTEYPFREMERYEEFEKEAKEAGRGLWAGVMGVVYLADGRTLKGKIISEIKDEVHVEMKYGTVVIDRKHVTRIEWEQK